MVSKMWEKLRTLQRSTFERRMKKLGYWPGMETTRFRLWWNDDDEMIVEEKKEDLR